MTRFFALAAILTVSTVASAAPLTGTLVLVETDIATFNPATFTPGPNVDVWNVVVANPNAANATSLQLNLPGPWQNFQQGGLSFKDSPALPTLGPNTVADSFFVLPAGTAPLAADTFDNEGVLASNFTVAGDTSLVDAGGQSIVATLTTLAGAVTDPAAAQAGFSGRAAISGAFEEISFATDTIPEPTTVLLAGLALVGFVARRS